MAAPFVFCAVTAAESATARRALQHELEASGRDNVEHVLLVFSELVTNAVRHAGTAMSVTVSRRGSGVHLAVVDGDPRLPSLTEPVVRRPPGYPGNERHGLWRVHSRASAWGAMPSPNGKVVWAIVRPPRRLSVDGPSV